MLKSERMSFEAGSFLRRKEKQQSGKSKGMQENYLHTSMPEVQGVGKQSTFERAVREPVDSGKSQVAESEGAIQKSGGG